MKHANLIKRLIKEVLSTPPKKESCNCGCHSCENVGNKGPVLNESLDARVVMTENMKYHVENKLAITENTFRYGSQAFLDLWAEARYLYSRDVIHVNEDDKSIITETNLGEYGIYEGQKVPLDIPMLENDSMLGDEEDIEFGIMSSTTPFIKDLEIKAKKGDKKAEMVHDKLVQTTDPKKQYELIRLHYPKQLNEAEKKKTPALNKPKRGGSKKFYVYVRNPKTKKIKKVSFGDTTGLSAKINNPQARKAFAARHKCAQKTDKTKASYWSCRLPRYASLLGLKSSFSGFW